jgi:hypothetical protein
MIGMSKKCRANKWRQAGELQNANFFFLSQLHAAMAVARGDYLALWEAKRLEAADQANFLCRTHVLYQHLVGAGY